MDIIPEAIERIQEECKSSWTENAHYEVGKAEDIIPRWYKEVIEQMLLLWIPRTGLDDKLLKTILTTPEKWYMFHVIYWLLGQRFQFSLAKVYDVNYIQSVDMFHTARIFPPAVVS